MTGWLGVTPPCRLDSGKHVKWIGHDDAAVLGDDAGNTVCTENTEANTKALQKITKMVWRVPVIDTVIYRKYARLCHRHVTSPRPVG